MKITYGMLFKLSETLNRMSGLTGKPGFSIAKTKRAIAQETEVFVELRDNLVTKYGESNENGGYSIKPGSKHWEEFIAEFSELHGEEVDVDIHRLSADEYDIDKMYCENATAADYELFELIMVEKKDEDKPVDGSKDKETAEG